MLVQTYMNSYQEGEFAFKTNSARKANGRMITDSIPTFDATDRWIPLSRQAETDNTTICRCGRLYSQDGHEITTTNDK